MIKIILLILHVSDLRFLLKITFNVSYLVLMDRIEAVFALSQAVDVILLDLSVSRHIEVSTSVFRTNQDDQKHVCKNSMKMAITFE